MFLSGRRADDNRNQQCADANIKNGYVEIKLFGEGTSYKIIATIHLVKLH